MCCKKGAAGSLAFEAPAAIWLLEVALINGSAFRCGEKIAIGLKDQSNMIFQHVDQVFVKPDLSITRPRFGAALVTGDAAFFDPFPSVAEIHIATS